MGVEASVAAPSAPETTSEPKEEIKDATESTGDKAAPVNATTEPPKVLEEEKRSTPPATGNSSGSVIVTPKTIGDAEQKKKAEENPTAGTSVIVAAPKQ